MALENLEPATRIEEILDGEDIAPATRLEYFLKQAASGGGGGGGTDIYIGIPVTMADAPPLPEGYSMSESYTGLTDNDLCPIYAAQQQTPALIKCVYPYMEKLTPVYIRDLSNSTLFYSITNVNFKFVNFPHVDDDPNGGDAILTVKSSSKLYSVVLPQTGENVTYFCIDKSDLEWVRQRK